MQLTFTRSQHDSWTVLTVTGEIDIATAGSLDEEIDGLLAGGTSQLVLDLSPVSFMDSTGLRSVITAQQQLESSGGSLAVVLGPGPVSRLFEVTGLRKTFRIGDSVADAVAS